ncbi:MAG: MarR family winged helix-turn-helix transcriptional regulator [Oscillospiraceae bacterium]
MRNDPGSIPPKDRTPGMLLTEIAKLIRPDAAHRRTERRLRGYMHLLRHLSREAISQLELARRTHLKAPTISVALHKMEQEGLVTRRSGTADQRRTVVQLTDKGAKLDSLVHGKLLEIESVIAGGVSEQEVALLKDILLRMRENLILYAKEQQGK